MYCIKCGNKIDDDMRFCPNCGIAISENHYSINPKSSTDNNKAHGTLTISFYLALANAPILFVIRMLSNKSETRFGSWSGPYTAYYVPDSIKAVMFVIMALIVIASMLLKKESKVLEKRANLKIVLTNIISIIIGLFIIFMEV